VYWSAQSVQYLTGGSALSSALSSAPSPAPTERRRPLVIDARIAEAQVLPHRPLHDTYFLEYYDADDNSEPKNPITTTLPERLPRATFAFATVDGVDADVNDEAAEAEGR
jgi:hypothetical protein